MRCRWWVLGLALAAACGGREAHLSRSSEEAFNNPCTVGDCETLGERVEPLPGPVCPAAEPVAGSPCDIEEATLCSYGDSLTSHCRRAYACAERTWRVGGRLPQSCVTQPTGACPSEPAPQTDCTVNQADTSLAPCEYADGVGCYCVGNRSAAQGGIVGDSGLWKCYGPPKNGACPELLPNLGEGCAVNGQNCVYGQVTQQCFSPYARVVCESGAWQDAGGDCAE